MKLFSKIITLSFCLSSAWAGEIQIENDLLKLNLRDKKISLASKALQHVEVKSIDFPSPIRTSSKESTNSEKWGQGTSLRLTHANGNSSTLTIYKNNPFLHIARSVSNSSTKDFMANKFFFLRTEISLGEKLDKLNFLGTGQTSALKKAKASYAYSAVADPESRNGVVAAWLSHDLGTGVLFPEINADKFTLKAQLDFGHFLLKPNQTKKIDTLIIGFFEDTRLGLESYANQINKQYDIKLPAKPGVYCTWYHRDTSGSGASTEKLLAENSDFISAKLAPFGMNVAQIDDRWQLGLPSDYPNQKKKFKKWGPYKLFKEANENFPGGMAKTADYMKSKGLVPGIWFMPFAGNHLSPAFAHNQEIFAKNPDGTPFADMRWSGTCIDTTHPKGIEYIEERVKRIYDWGYRYFKLDGLHTGMPSRNIYVNTDYDEKEDFGAATLHNPNKTFIEAFRDGMDLVRNNAPEAFILGCSTTQNLRSLGAAFGGVDAMRVGPDNDRASLGRWIDVTRGAEFCTNVYFLNNRVWYNDPDPIYVRESNPISSARWMASWMAVSGAMNTTSNQYSTLAKDRLDLVKRTLPTHNLDARPVDFLETAKPRIWLVQDERMNLVALFNYKENESDHINYDMTRLGLDNTKTYDAFDYWKNDFVRNIKGNINQTLAAGTCRVLALKEQQAYPQILGSSRNINQGLTDILKEEWDAESQALKGESLITAADPYELRIIVPEAANSWEIESVTTTPSNVKSRFVQDGVGVRVVLESGINQKVTYQIKFAKGEVKATVPEKVEDLSAEADYFSVKLKWNDGRSGSYVLNRNDGMSIELDLATYVDNSFEKGETYTYTVFSSKSGTLSNPVSVVVNTPKTLILPAVPPKPEIQLSSLKLSQVKGTLKKNKSCSGRALKIDGMTYKKGLGVHAESSFVVEVPKDYKRFVATVGLDDRVRKDKRASIKFLVYGIMKNEQEKSIFLAESPMLTAEGVLKWHFDTQINNPNIDRIELTVSKEINGYAADHGDWVNVGFLKK